MGLDKHKGDCFEFVLIRNTFNQVFTKFYFKYGVLQSTYTILFLLFFFQMIKLCIWDLQVETRGLQLHGTISSSAIQSPEAHVVTTPGGDSSPAEYILYCGTPAGISCDDSDWRMADVCVRCAGGGLVSALRTSPL